MEVSLRASEALEWSCYVSRQSFISLTTAVCFLTTCTGRSVLCTEMLADMVNSAKQARWPNSLSKYFPRLLIFSVSAHVFLGTHHTVLHLQAKLWACGEKSCCASAAPCQLLHTRTAASHCSVLWHPLHLGHTQHTNASCGKTVPKEFKSDLHLTMVWQGEGLWLAFH